MPKTRLVLGSFRDLFLISQRNRMVGPFICTDSEYRIYLAIRWGFSRSRMTANNSVRPMKSCYNTRS